MESSEINNFREKWRQEIDSRKLASISPEKQSSVLEKQISSAADSCRVPKEEQEAAELFKKAVCLEETGQVYDAIKYYRKAIALDPDIEYKVYHQTMKDKQDASKPDVESSGPPEFMMEQEDLSDIDDLVSHFSSVLLSFDICEQMYSQEGPHISWLPREMVDLILQWVISDQIDMQSFEKLSEVSRGFYLLCRNQDLWKRACSCTWGINTGTPELYGSWRDMYIMRPRLRFNGCYIAKITYFRKGENSFQDLSYEPYQLVTYYRYFRFFTNGIVLMITTTDEPQNIVGQLRTREYKNPQVMEGHFRLQNALVTMLFRKSSAKKQLSNKGPRRRDYGSTDVAEAHFRMEMEIKSSKHKKHNQLAWNSYQIMSVYYSGSHSNACMDIQNSQTYPPFLFSRVKSYTRESVAPLP